MEALVNWSLVLLPLLLCGPSVGQDLHPPGAALATQHHTPFISTSRQLRLNSTCLIFHSCNHEEFSVSFSQLEIHHWDMPERSAEACSSLCLQVQPSTELVFTKIIPTNEMLACGCGSASSITDGSNEMNDAFACHRCPDGELKCGGPNSVSVYELDRSLEECKIVPSTTTTTVPTTTIPNQLTYEGCIDEDDIDILKKFSTPDRSAAMCWEYCQELWPDTNVALVREQDDNMECSCGNIDELAKILTSNCSTSCVWGCGVCGGPNAFSAYSGGSSMPSSLLLLLLLLLGHLSVTRNYI